jgi:hypothetical protein
LKSIGGVQSVHSISVCTLRHAEAYSGSVRVGRRSTGPVRFARFVRGGSLLQIFCLILSFASNKRRCNELRCRAVATAADDGQRLPAEAVTDLQSHEQLDDLPSHATERLSVHRHHLNGVGWCAGTAHGGAAGYGSSTDPKVPAPIGLTVMVNYTVIWSKSYCASSAGHMCTSPPPRPRSEPPEEAPDARAVLRHCRAVGLRQQLLDDRAAQIITGSLPEAGEVAARTTQLYSEE